MATKYRKRKHARAEREMSSWTFRSSTPNDMSETDLTWRYKSIWNDIDNDDCLSVHLENILNPDLDSHSTERNMLFILEKLSKASKDETYSGYALQHALDEILYVITNDLLLNTKSKKPEKAIKKFKKHFQTGNDIITWMVDHEFTLIYDSELFDLKQYIGHENESNFWLTIHKLVIKYFQIDIELQKAPILNFPSVWSQTFKQALVEKLKEISPDKKLAWLSPQNSKKQKQKQVPSSSQQLQLPDLYGNVKGKHSGQKGSVFDEANLHHSANKTAENWYKEFLCSKYSKLNANHKQKQQFAKQHNKRVCDGCGHTIKVNRSAEMKAAVIYKGGWPKEEIFVFHDEICVKVRKYLEAIRQFVFDVDMYLYKNRRMSPLTNWRRLLQMIQNKDYILSIQQKIPRPLTPKEQMQPNLASTMNLKEQKTTFNISPTGSVNAAKHAGMAANHGQIGKYATNMIPKAEIAAFARKRKLAQYHLQIELIQSIQQAMMERENEDEEDKQDADVKNNDILYEDELHSSIISLPPNDIYDENVDFELVYGLNGSDISIPKIIRFMDVPQFGPSLFVYCLRSLEIKDRAGLWMIMQFIIAHLPTLSAISLLITHKNELLRFPKDNLNKLCLKIIQSSQFPIATSLYLCGYMNSCFDLCRSDECKQFGKLYTNIAERLCLFIESDHLLAILLEIPSDISELSILDICIEYELLDFLYSDRLRPIFNNMWTQLKYLDPSKPFKMKTDSYVQIFHHMTKSPSSFYYSPQGLFIIDVFYYILYLIIFTLWIIDLQYPYHLPLSWLEIILWIFNGGYFCTEFMEIIYKQNSYLNHFSKYWDVAIVLLWVIIAVIRWPWAWLTWNEYIVFEPDLNGAPSLEIDEAATKNKPLTITYIACVAIQSILIWTRSMTFLQRNPRTGHVIDIMFKMMDQVLQFTILLMLFLIGCLFALYYIMGNDEWDSYNKIDVFMSTLLYMFQTLLGQQDWDVLQENEETSFGEARSQMAEAIVVFFSIMGNIALLNLMIALMASVAEFHSPDTAKRVNYVAIVKTLDLVNKEAVLPAPFNLIVILGLCIYFALEMVIYIFSCSGWTYNIKRCAVTNYALNKDWVKLESVEMEKLLIANKNAKEKEKEKERKKNKKLLKGHAQTNKYLAVSPKDARDPNDSDSDDSDDDDDDEDIINEEEQKFDNQAGHNAQTQDEQKTESAMSVTDEEMVMKYEEQREYIAMNEKFWQKKEFSSLNCSDCIGQKSKKVYCRFCRNRMIANGDISVYFFLFRHHQTLDETDKYLLMNLLQNKILCPSCFRPVKLYDDDSSRLWRWQVAMEIISFYVFMIVGYLPILLFLLIPALFSLISHKCHKWTRDLSNDSEINAKYKQQCALNRDNVIFGGKDLNQGCGDHDSQSLEYLHVSSTIHNQYANFIKTQQNEGNDYMILPHRSGIIGNTYSDQIGGGRDVIDVQSGAVLPARPVQSKLVANRNRFISNELSPVIDSPLPSQQQHNNTYKEILIQLNEIKQELSVLKRYHKRTKSAPVMNVPIAINANSNKSRHSQVYGQANPNGRGRERPSYGNNNNSNNHNNGNAHNGNFDMNANIIAEANDAEQELSIPSMPSIPASLLIQHAPHPNSNSLQHVKQITIKPSKQQQSIDAVHNHNHNGNNHPHGNVAHLVRNNSNDSIPVLNDFHRDREPQQSLHDIIDDMSVGSMMTQTTVNPLKR